MVSFRDLPPEIVCQVLRELGNVKFLPPAILSCKRIHECFLGDHQLAHDVLESQIGAELLPYSVTLGVAEKSPELVAVLTQPKPSGPKSKHAESLVDAWMNHVDDCFIAIYRNPDKVLRLFKNMAFPVLLRMGRSHDLIEEMALQYAKEAYLLLGENEEPVLSASEHVQICRAFYRIECDTCPYHLDMHPHWSPSILPLDIFPLYPPWVNEQNLAAYEFLERRMKKAAFEFLAHDVYCGAKRIDPYQHGWNHRDAELSYWLDRGIGFLRQVEEAKTWDDKAALLKPQKGHWQGMDNRISHHLNDIRLYVSGDIMLHELNEEELADLALLPVHKDLRHGTYRTWQKLYEGFPLPLISSGHLYAHRRRGYIFWDEDRLMRIPWMPHTCELREDLPTQSAWEKMQSSFDERLAIWEAGGCGYWSADDSSKIQWRDQMFNVADDVLSDAPGVFLERESITWYYPRFASPDDLTQETAIERIWEEFE